MQFSFSFDEGRSPQLNSLTAFEKQAILATANAAGAIWSRYLPASDVTLDVRIVIDDGLFSGNVLAVGGPDDFFKTGATFHGEDVYDAAAAIELRTGIDPNGSDYELGFGLTLASIRNRLFFKTDEYAAVDSVRVDALSVFLHEIGHGLGIVYQRDEPDASGFSVYDTFVVNGLFMGPNAIASGTSGGLLLQPDSLAHLSESGPYAEDLMSSSVGRGINYHISALDLAILKDIGIAVRVPTNGDDVVHALHGIDLRLGDGNDTGYALSIPSKLYGENGNDRLFGGKASDMLFGGAGDDYLDGGGGTNTLVGENGDDQYIIASLNEIVIEAPGGGVDTVFSSVFYSLGNESIENLSLTGTASLSAIGNDLDNVITGNAALNVLAGGDGNDTYILVGGTIEYLTTAIALTSDPGDSIGQGQSRLFFQGPGAINIATGDVTLDGIVDSINVSYVSGQTRWDFTFSTARLGVNLLPGTYVDAQRAGFNSVGHPGLNVRGEGRGSNTLSGNFTVIAADFDYSSGSPVATSLSIAFEQHSEGSEPALRGVINWHYTPAQAGVIDMVSERPNQGTDTIETALSYSLSSAPNVENLTLTGSDLVNGAGRADANVIKGNAFANLLRGDLGNDTLDGGDGYDTAVFAGLRSQYLVTPGSGDTVTVSGPDGSDTAVNVEQLKFDDASVAFSLRARGDANGDNKADLLWQSGDGLLNMSLMNSVVASSTGTVSDNPGSSWRVKGSSDFDGNFKADVLWQHDDGRVAVWLLNGRNLLWGAVVGANPGPTWRVIAPGDFNGDGKADILMRNDDGRLVVWLMNGVTLVSGAVVGSNPGVEWYAKAAGDFDGDGKADILLQHDNGQIAIRLMDGLSQTGGGTLADNPGAAWQVVGTGDFNKDLKADILLQNSDGRVAVWLMDGTTKVGGGELALNPGPSWHARAADDINSDGRADILWQNENGEAAVWLMNGATRIGGDTISAPGGTGWRLANGGLSAVAKPVRGSFDGDRKSDLLWQHTDGTAAVWTMSGATKIGGDELAPKPGSAWHVIGAGDFNGDTKADVLWQHDDGTAAVWLMNGAAKIGGDTISPNPGSAWHVKAAGDFNADGKADILWQHNDGTVAVWTMNGATRTGGDIVSSNPGTSWQVKGSGDFNGDGKADILFQNTDGRAGVWLVNGTSLLAGTAIADNPGTTWHVKGSGDFDGDGRSDILWQNDDGRAAIWLMNGTGVANSGVVTDMGMDWSVKGAQDLNGDGKSDILFQNAVTGEVNVSLMSGINPIGGGTIAPVPGNAWNLIANAG